MDRCLKEIHSHRVMSHNFQILCFEPVVAVVGLKFKIQEMKIVVEVAMYNRL